MSKTDLKANDYLERTDDPNAAITKQRVEIMLAHVNGRAIECRSLITPGDSWRTIMSPTWDWAHFDYRVVPEPDVPVDEAYVPRAALVQLKGRLEWVKVNRRHLSDDLTASRLLDSLSDFFTAIDRHRNRKD